MKLKMFTVLDKTVGAYLPPFIARAVGEAERMFTGACGDPEHQFHKHLDDYTLFYIGEFDDGAGVLLPSEPMRLLGAREALGPDKA